MGLTEGLLTLNLVDEITETKGNGSRESLAQGASNILNGFFSGMGGCPMIAQTFGKSSVLVLEAEFLGLSRLWLFL